jgi:hypothetical protein
MVMADIGPLVNDEAARAVYASASEGAQRSLWDTAERVLREQAGEAPPEVVEEVVLEMTKHFLGNAEAQIKELLTEEDLERSHEGARAWLAYMGREADNEAVSELATALSMEVYRARREGLQEG